MAKAKKEVIVELQIQKSEETKATLPPVNVSEMTIIEIMHQKNLSREDAISFIKNNQRK